MLEAFIGTATVFVTQAIFVPYIMLMLEYREPVRFWRTLWIGIISVIVFLNIGCILYFDFSFSPGVVRSPSSCRAYSPLSSVRAALPVVQAPAGCVQAHAEDTGLRLAGAEPHTAFDLPVTDSPGHGLGVRSISAFCRKHGALCRYEQQDGSLRLRILL